MAQVPANMNDHSIAAIAALFNTASGFDTFMQGIGGSTQLPSIRLSGTRFAVKMPDEEQFVLMDDKNPQIPVMQLPVVLLDAWPGSRKQYYIKKFDPNSTDEAAGPDCFSDDGVAPSSESTAKQAEACSACQWNVFGTAIGADGKPSAGKRCSDRKRLVVYTQQVKKSTGGAISDCIFHFDLPAGSFKNFGSYLKTVRGHGIPDPVAVITQVSFDQAHTYPVLAFSNGGVLQPEVIKRLLAERESDAVQPFKAAFASSKPALPRPAPAPALPTPAPVAVAPIVEPEPEPAPAPAPASVTPLTARTVAPPMAAKPAPKPRVVPPAPRQAPADADILDMLDAGGDEGLDSTDETLAASLGLI